MGHADFKTQAQGLFIHRHDARHLGLHLPPLKVEAQAYGLPRGGQFPADDLHHRAQDGLFDVGQLPQRTFPAIPSEEEVNDRRGQGQIELQHRQRAQRLQPHRGHIADLRYARKEFVEWDLFGRRMVDLKPACVRRSQVVVGCANRAFSRLMARSCAVEICPAEEKL